MSAHFLSGTVIQDINASSQDGQRAAACARQLLASDASADSAGRGSKSRPIVPVCMILTLVVHGMAGILVATSTGVPVEERKALPPKAMLQIFLPNAGSAAAERPAVSSVQPVLAAYSNGTSTTRRQHPREEVPSVSIAQPTGPYYFRMRELTEKPALVDDPVADLVVRIPGLPPQPVILRLLISDEGAVDRVVVEDSFLAEHIEREVTDAFAKVRFQPGKIGRIAVRSQMRIEARLETMEHRLPMTASAAAPG